MLCGCSLRYHSHILLHQGEYLLVVLGVLVAHATTLHHFHRFLLYLDGLDALSVVCGREDKRLRFAVIVCVIYAMVHCRAFL